MTNYSQFADGSEYFSEHCLVLYELSLEYVVVSHLNFKTSEPFKGLKPFHSLLCLLTNINFLFSIVYCNMQIK